jgi:hypothetical protein
MQKRQGGQWALYGASHAEGPNGLTMITKDNIDCEAAAVYKSSR